MIVWIWDASGPAANACGVAGTAEAARRAAGHYWPAGGPKPPTSSRPPWSSAAR